MRTATLLFKSLVLSASLSFVFSCSEDESSKSESVSTEMDTLWIAAAGKAPTALRLNNPLGSAASVQSNFYAAYISKNEDCSDAIAVSDNGETPSSENMLEEPMLFHGDVPVGEYKCLVLKIGNLFSVVPDDYAVAAWPGVCQAGVETTLPICRAGVDADFKNLAGEAVTCTNDALAPTFIFASTNVNAVLAGPLAPSARQVVALNTSLDVPGKVTFHVDTTDQMIDVGGACSLNSAPLGFTKN